MRDYSEDWKSVAVIVEEIAIRESVDVAMCDRIGEEVLVREGKRKRRRYTYQLSGESLSVYRRALVKTKQFYAIRIIQYAIAKACNEEVTFDIEEIENFSVNDIPKRYANIASIVSNYWKPYVSGYLRALEASTAVSPNLCEQEGREMLMSQMRI